MIKRLLLMICLLAGASLVQAAPVILVFGDSLSAAYGIPQQQGWVALLGLRAEEHGYRVINASISGETTRGGLNRIDQALTQHQPAIVVVELGANDGLRGLSLDDAGANLDAIIRACHARKAKVLLIGMRLPPNYGSAYTGKFQAMYRQAARRHKVGLMPFLLEGFADRAELFQADGLHPTAAAQPLIMERVWRHLRPLLAGSG